MKHVLLLSLLSIGILPAKSQFDFAKINLLSSSYSASIADNSESSTITFQDESDNEKMTAVVFKAQQYCRIVLKDVDFDFPYKLMNATVYFSGTNFKSVEKGTLKSTDLKPIKSMMDRSSPGTMVVFDNVQVMGPDDFLRTIVGLSIVLR